MSENKEEEKDRLQKEYDAMKKQNQGKFFKRRASYDDLGFLDEMVSKLLKWNKEDIRVLKYAGDIFVNNGARIILNQVSNENKERNKDQYKERQETQSKQI
jgi:DNA modification methylase